MSQSQRATLIARRSRPLPWLSCLWAVALLGIATSATAVEVFHSISDSGVVPTGTPIIAEGGVQPVYLWIRGGTIASAPDSACNDGGGEEVCGFDLNISGVNGLTIAGFTPDGSANLVVNQTSGSIRINGLDTTTPGTGSQRIGELLVIAATNGELELTSGETVGADLSPQILTTTTLVMVPEPGQLGLLLSGVLMLGALYSRRATR